MVTLTNTKYLFLQSWLISKNFASISGNHYVKHAGITHNVKPRFSALTKCPSLFSCYPSPFMNVTHGCWTLYSCCPSKLFPLSSQSIPETSPHVFRENKLDHCSPEWVEYHIAHHKYSSSLTACHLNVGEPKVKQVFMKNQSL